MKNAYDLIASQHFLRVIGIAKPRKKNINKKSLEFHKKKPTKTKPKLRKYRSSIKGIKKIKGNNNHASKTPAKGICSIVGPGDKKLAFLK